MKQYQTDYRTMHQRLTGVLENVPHVIANLANMSALIYEMMEDINWAGFYLNEDGLLVLGPFQGKTACIEIPFGKGVCGTAAANDETIVVPDVHAFPGHIACDAASRSEIVVPVHRNGAVFGVLDIDAPVTERFGETDREGLAGAVRILEASLQTEPITGNR